MLHRDSIPVDSVMSLALTASQAYPWQRLPPDVSELVERMCRGYADACVQNRIVAHDDADEVYRYLIDLFADRYDALCRARYTEVLQTYEMWGTA